MDNHDDIDEVINSPLNFCVMGDGISQLLDDFVCVPQDFRSYCDNWSGQNFPETCESMDDIDVPNMYCGSKWCYIITF